MIDIHTHILPDMDDGARSEAESLLMLQAAVQNGIGTIVATPHFSQRYVSKKPDVLVKTDRLQQLVLENGLDLQILPGQEVRIYDELITDYNLGKIMTLANSRYMLIEFPANQIPSCAERIFYELEVMGIKPIIAHPERHLVFLEDPEKLYSFVRRGALAQLTTSSILGFFGKNVQKFSHQLIDANLIHVVASDTHNLHKRPFNLSEAYEKIFQKHGIEQVDYLGNNAYSIVMDETIYPKEPILISRKKGLGIFKR